MRRNAIDTLIQWKSSEERKPMILKGARRRLIFRSIASQLAKANEKFMYGAVRDGGRAREFGTA